MNAAYGPIAMLAERACGPIYNAIDTGNNTLAVRHADKVLQSQPDLALASALKALALVRSGKRDDADVICTKLVSRGLKKGEDNALTPLTWTLARLGRNDDEIALLEAAVKASPNDEALARQTSFALIKNKAFQRAQQLALKMHKSFTGRNRAQGRFVEEYFWWSILSYLLLARDPKAPGAALALPLSQRMIEKQIESKPLGLNDEEALCLLLQVLIRQNKKKDAFDLIAAEGSVGHTLCDRNLSLELARTDLAKELQDWQYVHDSCWARIDSGSRNWAHFSGFLEAAKKLGKDPLIAAQKKINVLLSVKGATKDRSVRLAELEVVRKRLGAGDQDAQTQLASKVVSYFEQFASKACCHEDLLPYLGALSAESRANVSEKVKAKVRALPIKNELDLRTNISIAKIARTVQPSGTLTEQSEAQLATDFLQQYIDGLAVGASLPETEMQPADDVALLGVQALLSAYRLSGGKLAYLYQTIALLELALTKGPKGYQLRMLLIRSYVLAGAFDRASVHYGLIGLKSVQADTLSHLISERCSAFSATSASGDEGLYKMAVRTLSTSQAIYDENASSTPEMIAKALKHGIYSRVEEFVEFGEALERSLQRQVLRLEESRSHVHNRRNFKEEEQRRQFGEGVERAVAAVRADVAKGLHDQRDFTVLVNYQPLDTPEVEVLTQVGPRVDAGWVRCIASTLSSTSAAAGDEADMAKLTAAEKALVGVAQSLRSGTFHPTALTSMLESTKSTVRALVDLSSGSESTPADPTRAIRPVDAIHEAAIALEAVYLAHSHLDGDSETKSTCKTHLAEIATLVNHLSRSTQIATAATVLLEGLASLGKEKVEQMMQSARDNVVRSSSKVFANLRDALRDAL